MHRQVGKHLGKGGFDVGGYLFLILVGLPHSDGVVRSIALDEVGALCSAIQLLLELL